MKRPTNAVWSMAWGIKPLLQISKRRFKIGARNTICGMCLARAVFQVQSSRSLHRNPKLADGPAICVIPLSRAVSRPAAVTVGSTFSRCWPAVGRKSMAPAKFELPKPAGKNIQLLPHACMQESGAQGYLKLNRSLSSLNPKP